MILIPQKLFADKQVTTILRDGNACIMSKELTEEVTAKKDMFPTMSFPFYYPVSSKYGLTMIIW